MLHLAMVGARAREWYDIEAKERQKLSEGRGKKGVVNLPHLNSNDTGKARDQIGRVMGVSGSSIDHATKVLKNAIPEVIKAVDEGRMAISTVAVRKTGDAVGDGWLTLALALERLEGRDWKVET